MRLRRAGLILLLLLPGLGLILALIGSVIVMAFGQSVGYFALTGESGFSWEHWREQLDGRLLWRSFQYSAYIATTSSILSVLLAYPIAMWLRRPFRGSLFAGALLKAPLLVPGLVAAFLFINVISFHGFFNELMVWLGIIDRPIRMQNDRNGYGVIFLQVWKNMPFALLLLTGSVQAISDDVLNAARDMGAGSIARFRKVILPLTVPAMQAALVIIFIGAAGDFSFQAVAGPTQVNSMAQLMVRLKGEFGGYHEAGVVAVLLMALALFGSVALAGLTRLAVRAGMRV